MTKELTWEQKDELSQQAIGFRFVKDEVYGLKHKWYESRPKAEKTLQYYDKEAGAWMNIPVKYNQIYVK